MKSITTFLSVLTATILISCNPTVRDQTEYRDSEKWGKVVIEDLDLKDFNAIEDNSCIDIVVNQGDEYKVQVEGNEKALSQYEFYIEENEGDDIHKLVCDNAKSFNFKTPSVRLHVTVPNISHFYMNGTGDLDIKDSVNFIADSTTSIILNGSGDVDIRNLVCNNIDIQIFGAGDLSMKRLDCKTIKATVEGSGDINIRNAKCNNANFKVLGPGNIEGTISAKNNIITDAKGSGDIELDVECKYISINSQGSGDIEIEGITETLKRYKKALGSTTTKKLRAQKIIWGD